jgi:hypothetical protein
VCPKIPPKGCSICGENKCVSTPDEIFTYPGQPSVQCGVLEQGGIDGLVNNCAQLPNFVADICGCVDGLVPTVTPPPTRQPTPPPTPAPTPPPTPAPASTVGNCPAVPTQGCSICGSGKCVSLDATFTFPGQPAVPCAALQQTGLNGEISPGDCALLPDLVKDVCGCKAPGTPTPPTASPTTTGLTSKPTTASPTTTGLTSKPTTLPPTKAPTPAPTRATGITLPPTLSPTSGPPTSACPPVPTIGCSICGSNSCVTLPDEVFTFPQQPNVPCGILQQAGLNGTITPFQCGFLPGLVNITCGCKVQTRSSPRLADNFFSDSLLVAEAQVVTGTGKEYKDTMQKEMGLVEHGSSGRLPGK